MKKAFLFYKAPKYEAEQGGSRRTLELLLGIVATVLLTAIFTVTYIQAFPKDTAPIYSSEILLSREQPDSSVQFMLALYKPWSGEACYPSGTMLAMCFAQTE